MRKYLATTALATLLSLGACARQQSAPMPVASAEQTTMSDTGSAPEYASAQLGDGAYVTSVADRYYARRSYRRRGYYNHPRYVVHRRSARKSAAIIGGSAAGGALIGGLAGGGKGAAIGALVGGGGGLAYDRATHKKVRAY